MRFIKNIITRALAAYGYKLERSASSSVPSKYFHNLAIAYKQCLNDRDDLILPNEIRLVLLPRLLGTPPSEAYYIAQSLARCKDAPGDVCEFDVAQGETFALIANEIAASGEKLLHLFDSFECLPKPSDKDQLKDDIFSLGSIEAYIGTMYCPQDMVQGHLDAISFPAGRRVIHKGFIEQLIHEDKTLPTEVCFAYGDFDFHEPTRIVLEFLHKVSRSGSIIIIDDYDYFSTCVKTAVVEFVQVMSRTGTVYDCHVPDTRYGHFAVLTRMHQKPASHTPRTFLTTTGRGM